MKKLLLVIFILNCTVNGWNQTYVNNRYSFNYFYCGFGSVISTDSCYYVKGLMANQVPATEYKDGFVKFDLNGYPNFFKTYEEDTIGLSSWESNNLIKTLDNNLAQIITTFTQSGIDFFIFIKQSPTGDTIKTTLLDTINTQEVSNGGIRALWPGHLLQLEDSSYLCTATVQNLDTQTSNVKVVPMVFKLDKNGNYLWHKIYWWFGSAYYLSRCFDFLQFDDSTFVMCNSYGHFDNNNYYNNTGYPKWMFIDSLGDMKKIIFLNDSITQNTSAYSFYKDDNNDFIYVGLKEKVTSNFTDWTYPIISKVDENFNRYWHIKIDTMIGYGFNMFKEVIPVSNTEYVAVGFSQLPEPDTNSCGLLVKFNTNGELLWKRKYVKVPNPVAYYYQGMPNYNYPKHELYDIDITPDSGFVMVGQAVNYNQGLTEPYGQLGWLVKTDKYGCLVPNCQQYDNIDTNTTPPPPTDSTTTPPQNVLYPNPVSTNLYFYNVYSPNQPITPKTCYIFNTQGQLVNQFTASGDKVTYIIDMSYLAAGVYIFKVVTNEGNVELSEKIVKI